MKILTIHNKYQIRGGEDECREAEAVLMADHGHETRQVVFENDAIRSFTAITVGLQTAWNHASYRRVRDEIQAWRPDIVSVHNFFPVASPSIYYAARECSVPVVQTLHNYRLLCPNGLFFRNGSVCEDCMGKQVPWPGVLHACYRESRPATLAVATMLTVHNFINTWRSRVDVFIALTNFARRKFIEGGLPPERLTVKPNFVMSDLGSGCGSGDYVLFVGRLTEDKGIRVLLDAWKSAHPRGRLIIAGDGPLSSFVTSETSHTPSVLYLGRRPLEEIYKLLGEAKALVFPSIWYEGMPRVIIESFSRGTPVIASRTGSMSEMVIGGHNGWLAEPGNVASLAQAISGVFAAESDTSAMRAAARAEFENKYTAERNYQFIMEIYERLLTNRSTVGS